jgi:hypothetical protein
MEPLKPLRLPFAVPEDVLANTKSLFRSITSESSFDKVYTPEAPLLDDFEARRWQYKIWWAYFDNKIYMGTADGGYRDLINTYLGSANIGNLATLFNPVERAVRAYEYVFDGKFGKDVKVNDTVDGQPTNKAIIDPIKQIWKWSNINGWKNELLIKTAALGTCGLRIEIVLQPEKKIFFVLDAPDKIKFVELDARENIIQLVREYEKVEGEFYDEDNPRMLHRYVQYMSREKFWMTRDGSWWNYVTQKTVPTKAQATVSNTLGIVPYVMVTQTKIGSPFGVPCFYGHERQIDHLNALAAHINQQIRRHVTSTWLIEGGGPKPKQMLVGDNNVWYIQKDSSIGSQVSVKDLVSRLDLGNAIKQQTELRDELANSIPEMKATDGQFLSHQSGGTVAQLRLPAEQRILGARTNIEAALVKAQQIALSLGILYNFPVWDLGFGQGSRARADKTYAEGKLDHEFNERPALPLTVDDKLTIAKASQATAAANNPNVPGVKGGNNKNIPAPTPAVSSTTGN